LAIIRRPEIFRLTSDYRQVGIAAVDPNLSFDDADESRLNFQARHGISYNVTDFFIWECVGALIGNLTNARLGQSTRLLR